jgi:hypothetical protein
MPRQSYDIKVIKCKLKSIGIKCGSKMFNKFIDCIKRTNEVSALGSLFVRSYILYKFNKGEQFVTPSVKLFTSAYRVLAKPNQESGKTSGAQPKSVEFTELTEFYKIFASDAINVKFDCSDISVILQDEATFFVTAYKNNIILNFDKYVRQFVNESFALPKIDKLPREQWLKLTTNEKKQLIKDNTLKAELIKTLMKKYAPIKNDLLYGTNNSDAEFRDWIQNVRVNIFPVTQRVEVMYDVQKNPLNYLKALLIMNSKLEKNEQKLFQPLPIRTGFCSKYVSISGSFLKTLLGKKYDTRIDCENVWDLMFEIRQHKFRLKNYKFDNHIMTDGQYVSISYINVSDYDKKQERLKNRATESAKVRNMNQEETDTYRTNKKLAYEKVIKNTKDSYAKMNNDEKNKVKKSYNKQEEFQYLEDALKDNNKKIELLDKFNQYKLVGVDPGKRSPGTFYNRKTLLNYSRGRRLFETKRLKYNHLRQKKYDEIIPQALHDEFAKCNAKTMNYKLFNQYIMKKYEIITKIGDYKLQNYQQYCSKLKWYSYINTRRHEAKLLNEIAEKFGEDCTIVVGDWSRTNSKGIKGISMPNVGFMRLLATRFEVLLLKEFNTSKIFYENEKHFQICGHLTIRKLSIPTNKQKERDQEMKNKRTAKQVKKKAKWKERRHKKYKHTDETKQVNVSEQPIDINPRLASPETIEHFKQMRNKLYQLCKILNEQTCTKSTMYSILTYKMNNNRIGCINRDRNATKNMLIIVESMLHGKGRPKAFQPKPNKQETLMSNSCARKCI